MGLTSWFSRINNRPKQPQKLLPERVPKASNNIYDAALTGHLVDLVTSSITGFSDEEASSIAKSCVRKIAVSAASVPFVLYRSVDDGMHVVGSPNHPIVMMLEQPNPEQSRSEFVMQCMQQIQRYGRCLIVVLNEEGVTNAGFSLIVADARSVHVEVDEYEGLLYTVNWPDPLGTQVYRASDVIDWRLPSTSGNNQPEGPWQIALEDLKGDGVARKWQNVSMAKRLLPDGMFKLPAGTSKAVVDDFKKQVEMRSGVSDARQALVSTGDVDFTSLSNPPAEADFIETRKFYRDQICAVFGVPPPVLGFMENATLANLDASKIMMWEDTVIPYLDQFCGALSVFINDRFEGVWEVRADVSGVPALRQRILEGVQAASGMRDMGVPWDLINERLQLGVEPFDGDGVGIIDANKLPLKDALGLYDLRDRDGY